MGMIYEHQCSVQLSIKLSYILKYWQKCANSVIIAIDKFAWFSEKALNFCQFIFQSLQEIREEVDLLIKVVDSTYDNYNVSS